MKNFQLPLALKLIFETFEPTEAWGPYVEFLPRELFHPMLFEPEDFIYLEGSRTYQFLTDHYFTYMVQYVLLYHHMLENPQICKASNILVSEYFKIVFTHTYIHLLYLLISRVYKLKSLQLPICLQNILCTCAINVGW